MLQNCKIIYCLFLALAFVLAIVFTCICAYICVCVARAKKPKIKTSVSWNLCSLKLVSNIMYPMEKSLGTLRECIMVNENLRLSLVVQVCQSTSRGSTRSVFSFSMEGMLLYRRVTPSIQFPDTRSYTCLERGTVRVGSCQRAQCGDPGMAPRFGIH